MTKETIEKIPFMERKHFVQNACLMYRKMIKAKDKLLLLSNSNKLNMSKFNGISLFEEIISLLNKDEALVIKKDFMDTDYKGEWYLDHWCKTSYYKIKHEAVNKFIYLLFS